MNFDDVLMKYKFEATKYYIRTTSVVDVGCGTGHYGYLVTRDNPYRKIVGIDSDAKKIRIAEQHVQGQFINMQFEETTHKNKWNVITAFNVLEHVDDPECFLDRCYESLCQNGKLIITVPNAKALHKRIGDVMGLSKRYKLTESDREKGHRRVYDSKKLKRFMEFCGFEIIAYEGIFLKPFPSDVMMQHYSPELFDALYELGKELPEYCSSIMVVGEK